MFGSLFDRVSLNKRNEKPKSLPEIEIDFLSSKKSISFKGTLNGF